MSHLIHPVKTLSPAVLKTSFPSSRSNHCLFYTTRTCPNQGGSCEEGRLKNPDEDPILCKLDVRSASCEGQILDRNEHTRKSKQHVVVVSRAEFVSKGCSERSLVGIMRAERNTYVNLVEVCHTDRAVARSPNDEPRLRRWTESFS